MKYQGKTIWGEYGPRRLDWCPLGRHHWANYGGNQERYRERMVCADCFNSLLIKKAMTTPTPVTTAEARAIAFSSRDKEAIDAIISLADQLDAARNAANLAQGVIEAQAQQLTAQAAEAARLTKELRRKVDFWARCEKTFTDDIAKVVNDRPRIEAELGRARFLLQAAQGYVEEYACGKPHQTADDIRAFLAAPRAERGGESTPADAYAYDWSSASEWAMWATVDADGTLTWFSQEPESFEDRWIIGDSGSRMSFGATITPNPSWHTSLRKRPPTADAKEGGK